MYVDLGQQYYDPTIESEPGSQHKLAQQENGTSNCSGGSGSRIAGSNLTDAEYRERYLKEAVTTFVDVYLPGNEAIYKEKENVYKELKDDPTLVTLGEPDDSDYQAFVTDHDQSNIGKLKEVQDEIEDGDIVEAEVKNDAVPDFNLIELNYKTVNSLYVNNPRVLDQGSNGYGFNAADQATLDNIALQNPLTSGDAVYIAQVILGKEYEYSSNQSGYRLVEEQSKLPEIEVHPNPNSGQFTIAVYSAIQPNDRLILFDQAGRERLTLPLVQQKKFYNLDLADQLETGVYIVALSRNDQLIYESKVVIQ